MYIPKGKDDNMRKLLLVFLFLSGIMTVSADDFNYLTFARNDGTMKSISIDNLKLSFAGGNMTIEGGSIYAYAASNDALDSNGNMIIKGGVVIAFGGGGAESGIDIDESHNLQISGGYIFGAGGRVDARFGTCTQAYGYTSNTLSLQGNYAVVADESRNLLFAVEMPKTSYSGVVLCSAPTMEKNTKYKVGYVSAVGGTNENGFVAAPTASNVTYPTSYYGSGGTFTAK